MTPHLFRPLNDEEVNVFLSQLYPVFNHFLSCDKQIQCESYINRA